MTTPNRPHSLLDPNERILQLSPSSLALYRTCPARWSYRYVHELEPAARVDGAESAPTSMPAAWGAAMHPALNTLHTAGLQPARDQFREAFQDEPSTHPTRTLSRGLEALELYEDRLGEGDRLRAHTVAHEIPFVVTLGRLDSWTIRFCGIIDRIDEAHGARPILGDYKTTGRATEASVRSYENDNQFRAYMWAAQKLGYTASHFDVDLIVLNRKTTDILREPIYFSAHDLEQWRIETLFTAENILRAHEQYMWPRHGRYACSTYNRMCEFWAICTAEPEREDAVRHLFYTARSTDGEEK